MANKFNVLEETQFSVGADIGKRAITDRERLMMEVLLEDRGFFAGAVAAPAPSPTPSPTPAPAPTPSPSPTPTATPAPTPTRAEASPRVLSAAIVRLAMTTVRPGDLITADFANNLVEALIGLDRRLTLLEDDMGKAIPTTTPTTLIPTPTPTPSRSKPIIDSVDVFTISGRGTAVTVAGKNLGEGLLERVLLGVTEIPLSSLKFSGTGFSFLTTAAIVGRASNRITVETSGGEDSAALPAKTKATPTPTVRAEK
ncbi:hypothetical protein [Sphingomonas sp. LM7]|uniref:hypothetical protein n=1 Tax=Sphingomonas sp. LM7 TaxID=1938607 RepID=UPI000983F943|nr:hypothetical protein [Sphingomonas sp. LM7]AQR73130.1 hypothetical protein BXU08_05065 [Sphingomonas sp. LM7]